MEANCCSRHNTKGTLQLRAWCSSALRLKMLSGNWAQGRPVQTGIIGSSDKKPIMDLAGKRLAMVLAGSSLDVGFTLLSPSGYRQVSDFRRSDGIHTVDPTEDGDYRVCFDNSFSMFSEKMVLVRLVMSGSADSLGEGNWENTPESDSMLEYKLVDIRDTIDVVHQRLERSRQTQAALRAFETRDRYLLEDNLWRVSFWSCANLLVMLAVALAQVYTLRRFFDDKRVRT
ncbi:transmembrane emp24 domain-containing protein 1a isoform X2 [Alosa sapidissima]|uniref:transmembrane emp24 domain-containing protein 1a isoform X2 n=1 Tax=Alosa sapidissima TaxID=34773 RepID=UPI001C097B8F|nr:transmembrane emp24 domain-containing protein 1a isoform X2 [Alosa sapidissima]